MSLVVLAAGLVLLAFAGVARGVGERLPAPEWARLVALVLGAGFLLTEVAVLSLALPVLVAWFGGPSRVGSHLAPGGDLLGWFAVAAVISQFVTVTTALRTARRGRRAVTVEPWIGERHWHGDTEVVVLPHGDVLAATAPSGQVLVSTALVDALAPAELAAVIRHEAAHSRHRHHRLLLLAQLATTTVPLRVCRASAAVLRDAVERWADEEAAGATSEGRAQVRRALLRLHSGSAGVGSTPTAGRLRALASDPPRGSLSRRLALGMPVVLLASLSLVAARDWTVHVSAVIAGSGRHLP